MNNLSHLRSRWRAVWNPDMYHGWGKRDNYFEGWYCKLVDPAERYAFAVIPGISLGIDGRRHSFIQVLDGKRSTATYHDFPVEAFSAAADRFLVRVGDNEFSAEGVRLNLPELRGELAFENPYPWPKMLGAPGIMGWYSFVPFMECYHGVVSVDHRLRGKLEVYGQITDFDGGRGYMEKDWGRSFPNAWIWTQTNHFDAEGRTSVMASVANIPWLGSSFVGYIVGFLHGERLYRFATYTGARMKAILGEGEVRLAFADRRNRLELCARQAEGGVLLSPISGNMTGKVNESMQARIELRLFEGEKLLFEGEGRNAGLEVAGQVETLLTDKWRR